MLFACVAFESTRVKIVPIVESNSASSGYLHRSNIWLPVISLELNRQVWAGYPFLVNKTAVAHTERILRIEATEGQPISAVRIVGPTCSRRALSLKAIQAEKTSARPHMVDKQVGACAQSATGSLSTARFPVLRP